MKIKYKLNLFLYYYTNINNNTKILLAKFIKILIILN